MSKFVYKFKLHQKQNLCWKYKNTLQTVEAPTSLSSNSSEYVGNVNTV